MTTIKKGIPIYDQCDEKGYFSRFGSSYVPETLVKPLEDLTEAFERLRNDKAFIAERDRLFRDFVGRPTPFLYLKNLSKHLGGAQIWTKHEAMAGSNSHKLNNSLTHCLIAKHTGKHTVVGDTGAGMAGSGLAMSAAALQLKAIIFQGKKDWIRQKPNSLRMKTLGAQINVVESGSQTLVDAVSETIRYFIANCDTTHMCVGSAVGPTIYVRICAYAQSVISKELKQQIITEFKGLPKKLTLIAAVGGGSSSIGQWMDFIDENCSLIGVEAGGAQNSDKHAAPLTNNSKLGVLHGALQFVMQSPEGQISETESISAGLDYPGVSPLHCWLKDESRASYVSCTDEEALEAFQLLSRLEGISASLEPAHALAHVIKIAPTLPKDHILVPLICGNAMKDFGIIAERLGVKI